MEKKAIVTDDLFLRKFCEMAAWLSTRSTERRKEIERSCRDLLKDEGEDVQSMLDLIFRMAEKHASDKKGV